MSEALAIGLDAGGTKTALRAEAAGETWATTGPGVNLRRDGLESAAATLAGLIRKAEAAFPEATLQSVCAGVAGASGLEATLAEALAARLDANTHLEVVHDAEIALSAAFGNETGVILIAGTGSVVYARLRDGRTLRAGGWGARLGDDGSGTDLGRAALRAVASAYDGGPMTRLTAGLREAHGVTDLVSLFRLVYEQTIPLAALAPILLNLAPSDPVATDLLDAATDRLAQHAATLVRRAGGRTEKRIALFGGLVSEAPYRDSLVAALAHRLPGWFVSRCETPPAEGALRRAVAAIRARSSGERGYGTT